MLLVYVAFLVMMVAIIIFVCIESNQNFYNNKLIKSLSSNKNSSEIHRIYNQFIKKLDNDEAFGFAHFNDGEVECAARTDDFNWVGWSSSHEWNENCDQALKEKISKAITFKHPQWYVGTPCKGKHHEKHRAFLDKILERYDTKLEDIQEVPAMTFHHNYRYKDDLFNVFDRRVRRGHTIHMVLSETADPKFSVKRWHPKLYTVSSTFAMKEYDRIMSELLESVKSNDIVVLLCGPLGRIVTPDLIKKNLNITVLCLGSFMDCFHHKRCIHSYAIDSHKYCEYCWPYEG